MKAGTAVRIGVYAVACPTCKVDPWYDVQGGKELAEAHRCPTRSEARAVSRERGAGKACASCRVRQSTFRGSEVAKK